MESNTPDTETMAQLTESDIEDLETLTSVQEAPVFHPLLRVWSELFKNIETERRKRPGSQWCYRMVQVHALLEFKDCPEVQRRYYDKLSDLRDILEEEIATDDECLNYTTADEDVANNSRHYLNLLRMWQMKFSSWELVWDPTDPHAAAELASLGEVHKTVFAQTGLFGHLDQIRFEFTEADQAALAAELEAQQEEANRE